MLLTAFAAAPAPAQDKGDKDFAICGSASKNADSAIEACGRILKADLADWSRRTAALLSLRGLAWKRKGDAGRAAADFTEAIHLNAALVPAYEGRGDVYRDSNQCAEAIADYDQAIRLKSTRAENYLGRSICRLAQGDAGNALADLDQVARLDANNAAGTAVRALGMKAIIRSQKGDIDGALADATEAIKLDPQHPSLYVARATLSALKGAEGNASALADLDQAIKLDEKNARGIAAAAWKEKGRLHSNNGDLDSAVADLSEAIRLDSASGTYYLDRAALLSRKGDNERALADYSEAITADGKSPVAYLARADFLRDQGQYDKAVADYDKSAEILSDNPAAYGGRALTRFYQGDFAKAAQDFRKVVEQQPNAYSLLWLYLSSARAGSARGARDEIAKPAAQLKADEWPGPIVQLVLGKKSSADAVLGAATTPEQKCEAQFYIGEWHLLQKDSGEAAKALQVAINSCPKDAAESTAAREEVRRLKAASR